MDGRTTVCGSLAWRATSRHRLHLGRRTCRRMSVSAASSAATHHPLHAVHPCLRCRSLRFCRLFCAARTISLPRFTTSCCAALPVCTLVACSRRQHKKASFAELSFYARCWFFQVCRSASSLSNPYTPHPLSQPHCHTPRTYSHSHPYCYLLRYGSVRLVLCFVWFGGSSPLSPHTCFSTTT